MSNRILEKNTMDTFRDYLSNEEKSAATIEKYIRDSRLFSCFVGVKEVTKELVIEWKKDLMEKKYAIASINSMLASVNSLFGFLGWNDCKVKNLKIQKKAYCPENKELTKEEYIRLIGAAKNKPQLQLVMETICGTGIRVSELKHFTVEAVTQGEVEICCKGKIRTILIQTRLRKKLLKYTKKCGIQSGLIFITKFGNPLNRSNVWRQMKVLCKAAGINPDKVFPHNLRKLFARCFYSLEKDIAKLADVLGHSSINTTRVYIMTSGSEHRRQLERLHLII